MQPPNYSYQRLLETWWFCKPLLPSYKTVIIFLNSGETTFLNPCLDFQLLWAFFLQLGFCQTNFFSLDFASFFGTARVFFLFGQIFVFYLDHCNDSHRFLQILVFSAYIFSVFGCESVASVQGMLNWTCCGLSVDTKLLLVLEFFFHVILDGFPLILVFYCQSMKCHCHMLFSP